MDCYNAFRVIFKIYFGTWNRLEVSGREHIPPEGGLIVVSNHTSYLDPLVLGPAMTRRMTYMAKKELFTMPLGIGKFVSSFSFPVDRERASLAMVKEAVRRLCAGEAIAMFPGGERARDGDGTENFRRGLDVLARLSKAAILPAYIEGAARSLPAGGWFPRPAKIRVRFGPPLYYRRDYGDKDAAQAVLDAIRRLRR